jgi:hypothetical protein
LIPLLLFLKFYPLSFSPKGERFVSLLPPWGKAGKGVPNLNERENIMHNNVAKILKNYTGGRVN